jgi:hypothetical protein
MGEELRELVSRSPQALGYDRSRWTLQLLREHLGEEAPETDAGTCQMLSRLGITHTRGQGYTLSPDEQFEAKQGFIDGVRTRVGIESPEDQPKESSPEDQSTEESSPETACPEESEERGKEPGGCSEDGSCSEDGQKRRQDRLFYLDEMSYSLSPTVASDWSPSGKQPTAQRGACDRKHGRLLAAMDGSTGRLFYRQKGSLDREDLQGLYQEMAKAHEDQRLWVVQDNAPFHFHPDVLRPLEPQIWPRAHPDFEYLRPPTWPDPMDAARAEGDLSVQLVPLPTYASWLNPIERLWRWLKQEVLHLHPYAGKWSRLKTGVREFLNQFADGSTELLQYTGLSSA